MNYDIHTGATLSLLENSGFLRWLCLCKLACNGFPYLVGPSEEKVEKDKPTSVTSMPKRVRIAQ